MSIRIHDLINKAIELKASDIHVSAGEVPAFRVDGEIHRMNKAEPLTNDDAKRLAYSMMQERQRTTFETAWETDFAVSFRGIARFRVNVYTQTRGIGFVMRQIPTKVLSMEQLGLPPVFQRRRPRQHAAHQQGNASQEKRRHMFERHAERRQRGPQAD